MHLSSKSQRDDLPPHRKRSLSDYYVAKKRIGRKLVAATRNTDQSGTDQLNSRIVSKAHKVDVK